MEDGALDSEHGSLEQVTCNMSIDDTEEDPLDAYMKSMEVDAASNSVPIDRPAPRSWRTQNTKSSSTKNRRYQKLQELLYASDYFSDESMEHRNPGLFYLHLGNYLSQGPVPRPTDDQAKLSEFLIMSIQKKDIEERKAQEEHSWGSTFKRKRNEVPPHEDGDDDAFQEEMESEDDDEMDRADDNDAASNASSIDEFSVDERRAHLIDVMSQRFLQGLDVEFVNYDDIDQDTQFDFSKTAQQDAEDRYFDAE
ncbi:Aste57867_23393 [Aphanomyces stellatus]|uniref:Aste57867_23393 protein n=1 Tax=Aphanomyces stellatus TaxID=120398 RepID=A0A485LPF9_9STRA|nr:hypothetical protein As57867_023322 [Aphanomyces stellatus]VFU00039.1 Aste57867_23393 [Aphanomyces stellatus]